MRGGQSIGIKLSQVSKKFSKKHFSFETVGFFAILGAPFIILLGGGGTKMPPFWTKSSKGGNFEAPTSHKFTSDELFVCFTQKFGKINLIDQPLHFHNCVSAEQKKTFFKKIEMMKNINVRNFRNPTSQIRTQRALQWH